MSDFVSFGASPYQMGQASQMRNQVPMSKRDRNVLHSIVHSGDRIGPYVKFPNQFRDFSSSYDRKAAQELKRIREEYNLK